MRAGAREHEVLVSITALIVTGAAAAALADPAEGVNPVTAALAASKNTEVARLAAVVLEVGRVKPHRRKRIPFLARHHRGLLDKLEETGLIYVLKGF